MDQRHGKQNKGRRSRRIPAAAATLVMAAGALLFVKRSVDLYRERQVIEAQIAANEGNAVQNIITETVPESQPVSTPFSGSVDWIEEDWRPEVREDVEKDGRNYELNPNIRTVLILGIDKKGPFESQYFASNGGQSDAIFLLVQDVTTEEIRILMIPRDTMTQIRLYDLAGNYVGQGVRHLTLAFAYGTSPAKSCENSANAVSQLLGGITINDYLAVTSSALSTLNDMVGGVTVTINEPGLEERDPALKEGAPLSRYIRYRMSRRMMSSVSSWPIRSGSSLPRSSRLPRIFGERRLCSRGFSFRGGGLWPEPRLPWPGSPGSA